MEEFFENELAQRFEQMIEEGEHLYFDSGEIEDIIIYYLELGDISYAHMAVKYGLSIHPSSLEIKIKHFEVLLEQEDYTTARVLMEELRESSMESTDYLVCCAKYYSNLGNPRRAIEFCQLALATEEEENFLHNFMGDEYVNLGDPFNALKHYQNALKADPQDDYALENTMLCYTDLKKTSEALVFLDTYLDEFPFSETAWHEHGQFHFNSKNYEQAIRSFDYLIAINSSAVGVYANKAACYEALGQFGKAIEVYQEMLELEYTKAFTYYKIGLCYKELKKLPQALGAFQKAVIEDPQFYLALMEQSYLYEELGAMREALHFASEAALLNAGSLDYQKRMAFLYIDAGRFEESLRCLQTLVSEEPQRFYNWYAYTEVLMLVGEFEKALEVLIEALRLHSRAELYYQLGHCYHQLKEPGKGVQALERALELDASLIQDMESKYPYIQSAVLKTKSKKK